VNRRWWRKKLDRFHGSKHPNRHALDHAIRKESQSESKEGEAEPEIRIFFLPAHKSIDATLSKMT
jgi:hypothetical protein